MNARVKFFAVARQLAGRDIIELELADGATVGELRQALAEDRPSWPLCCHMCCSPSTYECSTGWWVGPSSPRPTESCVHTQTTGRPISADRRTDPRM